MTLLLQAISRLVTLVLLAVLAVIGLAVAVFSVPGGDSGLAQLAELAQLPVVREEVGAFLETLEAGDASSVAWIAGFGAALVALLVILGIVRRRRERLLPLTAGPEAQASADADEAHEQDGDAPQATGRLAARRRPIAQMAAALAGRVRETESLSLKVRPRRRRPGGRLRIVARFHGDADTGAGTQRIRDEVRPIAEPFGLKPSVRARPVRENSR